MKAASFLVHCPLEVGDTVAVQEMGRVFPKSVYYIPHSANVCVMGEGVSLHTVTDIATIHYVRSGKVVFQYELDGTGRYQPLEVKIPAQQFDEAIKKSTRSMEQLTEAMKAEKEEKKWKKE